MLSVKAAAVRLGVSPGLVYSLIAGTQLRYARIGNGRGIIRVPEEAIEEYLARQTFGPETPKPPTVTREGPLRHLKL
jgi:excisionase family DNA binding protein